MKHQRWFLILILILLLVNIAYVVIMRYANVDELVREKLSATLSKQLNAGISIGNLDLTETTITISNVWIHDSKNKYDAKIRKIYINYNLLMFIYSGFQVTRTIRQITIYDPDIYYNYSPNPIKNKKTKPIDINRYFRRMTIYGGKVRFSASDSTAINRKASWHVSESLHDVQINVTNRRRSFISLQARTANEAPIKGRITLLRGKLQSMELSIDDYSPQSVEWTELTNIKANLGFKFTMKNPPGGNRRSNQLPNMQLTAGIDHLSADVKGHHAEIRDMLVNGKKNLVEIHQAHGSLDSSQLQFEGLIYNPLASNRTFVASVDLQKVVLEELLPSLKGKLTGNLQAKGSFTDPQITFNGYSDAISYNNNELQKVDVTGLYANRELTYQIKHALWTGNLIQGNGSLDKNKIMSLDLNLGGDNVPSDLQIKGKVHGNMDLAKGTDAVDVSISDLSLTKGNITLEHINGQGSISNKTATVNVTASHDQINIQGSVNLQDFQYQGKVSLSDYPLTQYIPEKLADFKSASVNAEVLVAGNKDMVNADVTMDTKEPYHDFYAISMKANAGYRFKEHEYQVHQANISGQYNHVPLSVFVKGNGNMDSLYVSAFNVNDEIQGLGWLSFKPLVKYGFTVNGNQLDIHDYLSYIAPFGKKSPYRGSVSLASAYNLDGNNMVSGTISTDSIMVMDGLYPFSSLMLVSGTVDDILIDSLQIWNTKSRILTGKGRINPAEDLLMDVHLDKYQIADITPQDDFSGTINAHMTYHTSLKRQKPVSEQTPLLVMDVIGRDCLYQDVPIDSILLKASQYKDYLAIDTLHVSSSKFADVQGKGSIGYNLLTGKQNTGDRLMDLNADADIIGLISRFSDYFISGHGNGKLKLQVGLQEDGLSVKKGSIMIPNGSFTVTSQTEPVSKVQINAQISDNRLDLKQCKFQWGKGSISIRNEIMNDDKDFSIAMLNLGQFFLKSSSDGVQVTVPQYSQPNTTVNAIIKGQKGKEATITGPWDDMHIEAEVDLSNGYGLYPPKTANLLQMINTVRESSKAEVITDPLPFTMDVRFNFRENMRYVTYPVDIQVTTESYFRLVYDGTKFLVPEALFASEQGSVDMFGTTFTVNYMEFNVSQFATKLRGTFYKKAYDGSTITLTLSQLNDPEKSFLQNLKFSLNSDNPEDQSNTQILAKLRYNRPIEELSRAQQTSMLQDEAIQLIGVNIGSSFIDPYLSPLESRMRKLLRVDFFNISPGFVENVVNEYVINNTNNPNLPDQGNFLTSQNGFVHFGSTILLNNLSINVGKYVFRSVFVDYTALIQETTNLAKTTELAVYHDLSLRVSLPWYWKLAYTFQIRPKGDKNSHEIFLQRSIRF